MSHRLSILIPLTGDVDAFEDTLASVLANRPAAACEIVALCSADYEDPYALGGEVRFHASEADAVCSRINEVLPTLKGDIVHLIGSGVRAVEGWTDAPLAAFQGAEVAAVAPCVVRNRDQRVLTCGVRRSWLGGRKLVGGGGRKPSPRQTGVLGPTSMAGFYRRTSLLSLGGIDETLGDDFFDLDLALELHHAGRRCVYVDDQPLIAMLEKAPRLNSLRDGRGRERLYRKHRAVSAKAGGHWLACCLEALFHLPTFRAPGLLCGRLAGWLETPYVKRRRQDRCSVTDRNESPDPQSRRAA